MGLHRLYWIPNELSGDKGVYVEYPAEELYAILSLESHRHQSGIVGENLGVVPPVVNRSMNRHNIAKIYVVQYEIFGDAKKPRLRRPPRNSVASLNTHDMPPFRSFYDGSDIDDRVSEVASKRGADPGQVYASLQKAGRLREIEQSITEDKVFKWLLERNEVG